VKLAIVFVLGALGCASSSATTVGRTPEGAPIVQIPLRLSNAFLVKTTPPVLVDSGTAGDLKELDEALSENGTLAQRLGLVVITHAHADHAGVAADLQRLGSARIMIGAGDSDRARTGKNDELLPTGFTASVLKPFIPNDFPEVTADIAVREPVDLAPWGLHGQVLPMPGHTKGSLVVVLANRSAFVGDMIAGGSFGGLFFPTHPQEHLYHADREQNRRNIERLLAMGIETFYLGHGGPVTRADVSAALAAGSL
jgi:glyoxylase-like metal-dependent hydrolase (beta-lactamase superfamily II)